VSNLYFSEKYVVTGRFVLVGVPSNLPVLSVFLPPLTPHPPKLYDNCSLYVTHGFLNYSYVQTISFVSHLALSKLSFHIPDRNYGSKYFFVNKNSVGMFLVRKCLPLFMLNIFAYLYVVSS
jgi:hypothetical protein